MKNFFKNNWQVLSLAASSFLTRFLFLGYPKAVVFDEIYFGTFAKDYFTATYYFDNHPPLGKLMIYFFAKIFGLQSLASFDAIDQVINGTDAFILRFLPALFGAIFVLLIYFLILKIGLSKKSAFLGAALVLLDNAILTQSRFILIDIFLLFFGFLSFYFLLCFKDSRQSSSSNHGTKKSYLFLALAAVFAALAFSIKWTGLTFLALVVIYFFMDAFKNFGGKRVTINLLIIIVLPVLIYYSIFAIHFALLGDLGFSGTFLQKFFGLNQQMLLENSSTTDIHPFGSKWYQWPLDKRPIWYWNKQTQNTDSNIYLVGNVAVWLAVFLVIAISIILLPHKFFRRKLPPIFYILLLGYFTNLLAYIFIKRVAFLYHYFPSLIFGILILVILYETFIKNLKHSQFFYWPFLFLVLICFLLILPLTYGIPLPLNISHYYNSFIKFLL